MLWENKEKYIFLDNSTWKETKHITANIFNTFINNFNKIKKNPKELEKLDKKF